MSDRSNRLTDNIRTKDVDQLDDLPTHERMPDYSWDKDKYFGYNFPYKRFQRWLDSCVGSHLDDVISEYTKAKWVPKTHRTVHQLGRYLEINTIHWNGKICYHDDYHGLYVPVENSASRMVYVDPDSKIICLYIPPTRESWEKTRQRELAKKLCIIGPYHQFYKKNGVWYEIKAKICETPPGMFSQRKGPNDILLENKEFYEEDKRLPFVEIILEKQANRKQLKKYGLVNDVVFTNPQRKKVLGIFNNYVKRY